MTNDATKNEILAFAQGSDGTFHSTGTLAILTLLMVAVEWFAHIRLHGSA